MVEAFILIAKIVGGLFLGFFAVMGLLAVIVILAALNLNEDDL